MLRKPERWRDLGKTIHAGAHNGIDYTLCGVALEEGHHGLPLVAVTRGKINCVECVGIIRYVKSIPRHLVVRLSTG